MTNVRAIQLLDDCKLDLDRIDLIIMALGSTNSAVPFLTKYAIIKVCGTLEQCFKTIISDFATHMQGIPARNFIDITFRESSMNPNIDNIYKSLSKFNDVWKNSFKGLINGNPLSDRDRILASIKSLNNARNQFAHGGNPTTSFTDVQNYFTDVTLIIQYLDSSVV